MRRLTSITKKLNFTGYLDNELSLNSTQFEEASTNADQ